MKFHQQYRTALDLLPPEMREEFKDCLIGMLFRNYDGDWVECIEAALWMCQRYKRRVNLALGRLLNGMVPGFPGWTDTQFLLPNNDRRFLDELFNGNVIGRDKCGRILSFGAAAFRAGFLYGKAWQAHERIGENKP